MHFARALADTLSPMRVGTEAIHRDEAVNPTILSAIIALLGIAVSAAVQYGIGRRVLTADFMKTIVGTLTSGHQVAQERRLKAIEQCWRLTLKCREFLSNIEFLDSLINREEFETLYTEEDVSDARKFLDDVFLEEFKRERELWEALSECRPYLGEDLWWEYYLYRQCVALLLKQYETCRRGQRCIHWTRDTVLRRVVSEAVLAPVYSVKLLSIFEAEHGSVEMLFDLLEQIILAGMQEVITGKQGVRDSLRHFEGIKRPLGTED